MDENQLYAKRLWIVGGLVAAMLVAIIAFFGLSFKDQAANLDIVSAPDDASFLINGKKFSAGKSSIDPGEYKIVGSREGFKSLTQTVTVGEDLTQVTFALTPESEEAKKWAKDHPEVYAEVEATAGQLAEQQGQAFRDKYPLVTKLPYNGSLYSINYARDLNNEGDIYIRIDTKSALGRQVAIAQIREWGFNPTDYSIIFPGLHNPFNPDDQETPGE